MRTSDPAAATTAAPAQLRKSLNVWQAIGVSVALMAPAMAANINPQGTASVVGRAVPLSFALATVGALLIAWSFVRLTQRFNHAGSVYGFVGATMGPRAGIFSGWLLAIAYAMFGIYTAIAAGRFINDEVRTLSIWPDSPDWMGYTFTAIALVVVLYFSTRSAQGGTKFMLIVEGLTVLLILIVTAVVLGKLLTHHAPGGQKFDASVFQVPAGTDFSSVFLGVVFGFLSFAGFEGAATLGEETKNPRRDVPRAIVGTVVFGGVFFIVVTAVEVMGFGTDQAGLNAFTSSSSLMGDLSSSYLAGWIGHLITIGAAISAISCATACTIGSSRLVFALSRDGAGPAPLAAVSKTHQVPGRAVIAIVVAAALFCGLGWIIGGGDPLTTAIVAGTAGTLILLVAYFMATVGSIRLVFFTGQTTVRRWEIIIPILGVLVLVYTMWRNVYPFPTGSAWWGPGLFLGVTALILIGILVRPDIARRAGAELTRAEGLAGSGAPLEAGEPVGTADVHR